MSTINELYQNVSGKNKDEYRDYLLVLDRMDWHSYDYTTWPCADLSFQDLDTNENYDVWPFKPNLNEPHWVDLNNQFPSGIRRYGYVNKFVMPEQVRELSHDDATDILNDIKDLKDNNAEEFNDQINEYGFSDEKHFLWGIALLDDAEEKAYDAADDFLKEQKAKLDAQMDAHVEAAEAGGLLDPISGIDMETWAAANAKIAGGMDLEEVLKVVGTEKPIWDEVSAEWTARMSQDTTFAISKVYGDAFMNSNIGKFASEETNQGSASSSSNGSGGLNEVMEDFELYIKIMCHQNMGATQGKDAASILQEYGLTVTDWSSVGAHWSPKMATDTRMALQMGELMEKYNAEFASAKAGDDIDF
ncbi:MULTISPECIES: DUF6620 family protein [Aquimarina]|uniref:Uncharacterized protein n=1 Tax=Aquimarina algiphila TaxID=2047982 RepID=A0A554VL79_9FLAO|nr:MULTISPECIES: DUF6620 family protein [Aquimarina]TSE08878.1 hypothetical protein FOF46_10420 [Aquimarina algiphila]